MVVILVAVCVDITVVVVWLLF